MRVPSVCLCIVMFAVALSGAGLHESVSLAATPTAPAALAQGEKADPGIAGKAIVVKELPKALAPADRKALEAVVRELKADRLEAGLGLYRSWADAGPKALWRDDATNTALWVFREGLLSRSSELSAVADRVRFLDERSAAIDDSIALLRGAILTKKPVLVARIVTLAPYARDARGDEKRERQLALETLDLELRSLEAKGEETRNERNSAKAAFASTETRAQAWLQVLHSLTKRAADMKLTSPKRV